jgi:hypothetical protein
VHRPPSRRAASDSSTNGWTHEDSSSTSLRAGRKQCSHLRRYRLLNRSPRHTCLLRARWQLQRGYRTVRAADRPRRFSETPILRGVFVSTSTGGYRTVRIGLERSSPGPAYVVQGQGTFAQPRISILGEATTDKRALVGTGSYPSWCRKLVSTARQLAGCSRCRS